MRVRLIIFVAGLLIGGTIGVLRDSLLPWLGLTMFPATMIALLWGGGDSRTTTNPREPHSYASDDPL